MSYASLQFEIMYWVCFNQAMASDKDQSLHWSSVQPAKILFEASWILMNSYDAIRDYNNELLRIHYITFFSFQFH